MRKYNEISLFPGLRFHKESLYQESRASASGGQLGLRFTRLTRSSHLKAIIRISYTNLSPGTVKFKDRKIILSYPQKIGGAGHHILTAEDKLLVRSPINVHMTVSHMTYSWLTCN